MCHGQLISTRILTARKQRQPCDICERPITPGMEYVMHTIRGYDEGLLSNWKLCQRCGAWWAAEWEDGMDYCPMDPRDYMRESTLSGGWARMKRDMRRGWALLTGKPKEGE